MNLLTDDSADIDLSDPVELGRHYLALWNEPDAAVRHRMIRQLWAPGGGQTVSPPQQIVDAARDVGFPGPPLVVRGYRQLDDRVARAYDEFVGSGTYRFQLAGRPARLADVVTLNWEMVDNDSGQVAGAGLDVFVLDGDDRIESDYQFILG